ncbi:uncharacterized protein LOC132301320 [Cornus florida]|uniref:uncharacterized protein LOC132301320 n=1 Tax=Cornus florida TaxID=4283 RepID=UPI002898D73A|nr:uncharacterized protein LOC132301320 [Cornus florida]
MFNFIFKSLPYLRCVVSTSPIRTLHFLQHDPLSSSPSLKSISTTSDQHSFTVDYLTKSCGLRPEEALSASKYITIKTPDKPDSVLAFFSSHEFTETQISLLIRRCPRVLMSDPENTLFPKIVFFHSKGFLTQDSAKILSTTPAVWKTKSSHRTISSRNSSSPKRKRMPLLNTLLGFCCVPELNIVALFTEKPQAFTANADRFKEIVEEVKKMGFNPTTMMFGIVIHTLGAMSKSTWEKKVEVYKKWGLSEDEMLVAFVKHLRCMMASEDKIMGMMDFFVNKMGWESSIIVRRPGLLSLSLERRIIPRCLVYQILLSKGLIKKDFGLIKMMDYPESYFIQKYVKKYEEEAPELLKLYQDKLNLSK